MPEPESVALGDDVQVLRSLIVDNPERMAGADFSREDAALDRLTTRLQRAADEARWLAESRIKFMARTARLETALREIADKTWAPAVGGPSTPDSQLHDIARRALDGELESGETPEAGDD